MDERLRLLSSGKLATVDVESVERVGQREM